MKLEELCKRIENNLKLRNFSGKTVKAYLYCLKDYFLFIKNVTGDPTVQIGKVERSHRTDQEMFYDRHEFKTILGLK